MLLTCENPPDQRLMMSEQKLINKSNTTKRKSKSIFLGSIVALIIAISPYIFYTYNYFPKGEFLDLFFFTYESKYQESIVMVMWLAMNKIIPIILLILWFFTCKHWWYHVILIPIAMFSFQLFSQINEDRFLDETEIYWLIPIMLVITPFVYFIRVKLFDKHVLGIDLEAMDAELKQYKEKERLQKEKEEEAKKL
tara:strand:- start:110 stop:694 length:585 start_codon:yes stop_codon:yes gene_type:complete